MAFFSNETDAAEWVVDTLLHFPEAELYYSTRPRYSWHGNAPWFTLKIGAALVAVASHYDDGIWQVWASEADYEHDLPFATEGIFDCDYADRNQEHWDEYIEAIEEYSGLEG